MASSLEFTQAAGLEPVRHCTHATGTHLSAKAELLHITYNLAFTSFIFYILYCDSFYDYLTILT